MADAFVDSMAAEAAQGDEEFEEFLVGDTDGTLQGSTLEEELEAVMDDDELAKLFSDEEDPLEFEEETSKDTASPERKGTGVAASPGCMGASGDAEAEVPPPPQPYAAWREAGEEERQEDYKKKGDKGSRFTMDPSGNLLHKWKADYATQGGGGRAQCRDTDCLERHDQGGVRFIEKGTLRIGRRVTMPGRGEGDEGQLTLMWFHARCIFNSFRRARKATRIIQAADDIEGFTTLSLEDQNLIRRIIEGAEDCRKAKFGTAGPDHTPTKRTAAEMDAATPIEKRRRSSVELPPLKAGDRIWIHCKVKSKPSAAGSVGGDAPAGVAPLSDFITKSVKPELGKIVDEPKDGTVIVQFEKADHEKERQQKYGAKKFKMIRGWLRYPRIFEGQKQRLPLNWIDKSKQPPKLCGCTQQQWGHACEGTGISCGRGTAVKVWGLDF